MPILPMVNQMMKNDCQNVKSNSLSINVEFFLKNFKAPHYSKDQSQVTKFVDSLILTDKQLLYFYIV